MREISLHISDIAQNSVKAEAKNIFISVEERMQYNLFVVEIKDDGVGMDKDTLDKVKDPFVTSRTERKVGLGISLFEACCLRCEGDLQIKSEKFKGTYLKGIMKHDHIDRPPLGRIYDTVIGLLLYEDIDILYKHKVNEKEFCFDSKEIKSIVENDITRPDILKWIKEYIIEGIQDIGAQIF